MTPASESERVLLNEWDAHTHTHTAREAGRWSVRKRKRVTVSVSRSWPVTLSRPCSLLSAAEHPRVTLQPKYPQWGFLINRPLLILKDLTKESHGPISPLADALIHSDRSQKRTGRKRIKQHLSELWNWDHYPQMPFECAVFLSRVYEVSDAKCGSSSPCDSGVLQVKVSAHTRSVWHFYRTIYFKHGRESLFKRPDMKYEEVNVKTDMHIKIVRVVLEAKRRS